MTRRSGSLPATLPGFDGETYEPEQDKDRLSSQLRSVYELMTDGLWRTLPEIATRIDRASEASVSARLRDLRKVKFGGHEVHRRRRSRGLFEYRLIVQLTLPAAGGPTL
jgi:hypothetical protein